MAVQRLTLHERVFIAIAKWEGALKTAQPPIAPSEQQLLALKGEMQELVDIFSTVRAAGAKNNRMPALVMKVCVRVGWFA